MSELDYPPAAVELQIDQMVRNTDMQLRQMGLQGMQQYLELVNQSMEQYRDSLREQAEKFLRRNLIIAQIAEAEQLTASDEEFEEHMASMLGEESEEETEERKKSRQDLIEAMRRQPNREAIDDQIISEKAIERILAIARGEEVPEPDAQAAPAEVESSTAETEAADETEQSAETPRLEAGVEPVTETIEESEGRSS
jgi:trigger factor